MHIETWNRLTATREQGVEGKWWKEGEGISQRTCMNDPQTWTKLWGLTVGAGVGWAEEVKGEKIRTTVTELQ